MQRIYITIIVLFLLLTATTKANEPLCPPPQLLATLDLPGTAYHSSFHENYAYILTDNSLMLIIDLSDPTNPAIVGSITLPASVFWRNARVNGNMLYINEWNTFLIIDITDPTNPQYIDTHTNNEGSRVDTFAFHNDYLYLGKNTNRLEIIDISNPAAPVFASLKQSYDGIIAIINNVGYTTKAQAVDLSDPINPILQGSPPLFNHRYGFHHDRDILYMLGIDADPISIADPLDPTIVPGGTNAFSRSSIVMGSIAYSINDSRSGLTISDISHLRGSVGIASVELTDFDELRKIHAYNTTTYILTPTTIQAYRIISNPVPATRRTLGPANNIALAGNTAIIACEGGLLELYDIADHTNIIPLSTIALPDDALAIDFIDTIAYVATRQDNLNLVDFSDPTNPTLITNIDTGRRAQDIKIIDNLAYLVDRIYGLSIFDLTDPTNPQLLSTTDTFGWAGDITIDDTNKIAYIAHGYFNLQIMDIADTSAPKIIGSITPIDTEDNGIVTTTLNGNYLYTAEGNEGYRIFDVSNPANPIELDRFEPMGISEFGDPVPGFTHQLTIDQTTLHIANGTGGFIIYNNTDPFNPIQTKWIQSRASSGGVSSVRRIQLRDAIAYSTVYEGGFRIYNTANCTPCIPDFNNDGSLNFFDITAFIEAFTNRDPATDLNADGRWNFFDISTFLTLFTQGCP